MAHSSHAVEIYKISNGKQQLQADSVAVEEPLEIRLGWSTPEGRATRSISITMRTPGNDRELAAGFLFSESIVHVASDIASLEPCGDPAPDSGNNNIIKVELAAGIKVDLARLQRHFYTSSSCGVCGKTSLDALHATGAVPQHGNSTTFRRDVLTSIPAMLRASQKTFDATGGLHAAAAFTQAGELVVAMEDVGRHNAVDKVVGALLLTQQVPAAELGLMVSGRASFELMQKALLAGMPLLAAVSAPSSLAVQLAKEFDVTLVGFLRGESFNIYSGEQRISA
ncbi:MAG: formate dehydrogenase accessory sulfurtransferase FdhD [Gammaproteobacteria bacterium]|nr:formate dehydrogenase accessory sulfurtransferase FdhD [Gammaproteobacteria bacterium]